MTDEIALETEIDSIPTEESSSEAQPDEMISKKRAEELVKKAKLKGRDSMQAELEALKAENAALKSGGSMGGMAMPVDPEVIKQQILADLQSQFQQASEQRAQEEMEREANKIVDTYRAKMSTGKDSFEDFEQVMADFNPQAFPNLVFLASQMENTPAVMYELMKNPSKWATVAVLSERDPKAAQNMLTRISDSIKANQQAKAEEKDVPPPLGRLSSTPTGQDAGKPASVRDFKAMFRG